MYPPSDVCKALWRIHPHLRLAWAGRPPTSEDDINSGSFALVQLYHVSDVGRVGEEHTFRALWKYDTFADDTGNTFIKTVDRGPIFSKDGSPINDWKSWERVPVFVCSIDGTYEDAYTGEALGTKDVFSGRFLDTVRHWLTPIKDRVKQSVAYRNKEICDRTEDMSGEMTEFLWHEAQKSTSRRDWSVAKKFARDDKNNLEKRQAYLDAQLRNTYKVPT